MLAEVVECIPVEFAGDTKLGKHLISTRVGLSSWLEEDANRNLMKLNKDKYQEHSWILCSFFASPNMKEKA